MAWVRRTCGVLSPRCSLEEVAKKRIPDGSGAEGGAGRCRCSSLVFAVTHGGRRPGFNRYPTVVASPRNVAWRAYQAGCANLAQTVRVLLAVPLAAVGCTYRSSEARLGVFAVSVAHLRCDAYPVQLPVQLLVLSVVFMRYAWQLFAASFREAPAFWGFRRLVATATARLRALTAPIGVCL